MKKETTTMIAYLGTFTDLELIGLCVAVVTLLDIIAIMAGIGIGKLLAATIH